MIDRTYYRAEGKTLERVKEWQEAEQAAHDKMLAFCKRFGVERFGVYNDPYRFSGLVFDGPAPEGWRTDRHRLSVPKRNTPAGKALHKEMASIRGIHFDELLGGDRWMATRDGRVRGCTLEHVGDAEIVGVPNRDDGTPFFVPEDAVPLLMSEYWALKEAVG